MDNISTHDKVRAIRAVKPDLISELSLKKVMLGGYDCKEVQDYINLIKSDIQVSEAVFKEKLEEYSSTSEMYLKERDRLLQILDEKEKNLNLYKAETSETIEQSKRCLVQLKKENEELKSLIKSLKEQQENNQQNIKLIEEIQEIENENIKLKEANHQLLETQNNIISEKVLLNSELDKALKVIDKFQAENNELKKIINQLKLTNRNNALLTNIKVFEYKQNQQINIDNINSNIQELIKSMEDIKANLSGLSEKTKIEYEE